ncbi:protein TsetseEP-like [Olea europaea var. sylvestris]|uniref:protein TsetseEP-like n=1 Tax=Olea europaea var. sylvestris TaxID=158386 RepID=UPI000C1CCCBC|nr:protein TsetseEP-like [Olea europaea var. sylvestris]
MARTYRTARKTTACKATLNQRSIIQSYENYVTNSTRSLVEHVQDIYERCMAAVDVGLEITHIEVFHNLINSLPPQWRDVRIVVRDEMRGDEVEDEAEPELGLEYESNPEEEPESEHEDNLGLELEDNLEPQPEPQVEIEIESGPEAKDSLEDDVPPKKIRRIHGN